MVLHSDLGLSFLYRMSLKMVEHFLQLKPHRHTFRVSFSGEKALMLYFFGGGVGGGSLKGGVLTRHD